MKNVTFAVLACVSILSMVAVSCTSKPATTSTPPSTSPVPASSVPTTTAPPPTSSPPVSTPPPATTPVTIPPPQYPPPSVSPQPPAPAKVNFTGQQYVVFAWNDLGMHCANPTYDQAVLLPPYNNVWAQVIKRGNPPQVVTAGLTVSYRVINNTYSYGKRSYGQFWDNALKLFGGAPPKDTGLNLTDPNIHNGLAGTMVVKNNHFEVDGIPVTPVDDAGNWNPYQRIEVTVKDGSGAVIAQTQTMLPISDEIDCAKCHGPNAFQNILQTHDKNVGTDLVNGEPVLCASCHSDPALGSTAGGTTNYLSGAIHSFHATVVPQPACYDCHPGAVTQCRRSLAHTAADGNCTTCHGTLAQVGGSVTSGARTPWLNEPTCVSCHPNVSQVDTGSALYRNSAGHGSLGCPACHSSPHAMVPSSQVMDNYQALQYQGIAVPIGSCAVCHQTSRGQGAGGDYAETHGGINPRVANTCDVCHTAESSNTALWPHAFQWKPRAGTGIARGD